MDKLKTELGSASNIKSRQNRQSVQRALKRVIERLKANEIFENGAIILSGGFDLPSKLPSEYFSELKNDLFVFEPSLPIKQFSYYCGKKFQLDQAIPLFSHQETSKKYGIGIIHGTDAELFIYLPDVDLFEQKGKAEGRIRNKHGRGGFSQNRFQRLRENEVHATTVSITDSIEKIFFSPAKLPIVEGIILVGNGDRKKQVAQRLIENLPIKQDFISVITSDGSDDKSLEAAKELICTHLSPQKFHLADKEILELVELSPDRLVFGKRETENGIKMHLLQKVYILKDEIDEDVQEILQGSSAEIICLGQSHELEKYGGFIGVTWY